MHFVLLQENPEWRQIRLHRCLQHTKQNLRSEAKRRDAVSGERRCRNDEMLPVLVTFLLQSAWFPRTIEFSCFWRSVLSRLRGQDSATDWSEPAMADYIETNLLQLGPDGLSASWQTGLGVTPLGFTTFSSNAQERSWRTVKGLLKKGFLSEAKECCPCINKISGSIFGARRRGSPTLNMFYASAIFLLRMCFLV